MSNYTISVDWDGKDDLADSNAAKVISGDDFQTEFETVQTAVNSKANLNGSSSEGFAMNNGTVAGTLTVTGIPTIPTAAEGTNTTQAASTAFVKTAADALNAAAYPVGAIFTTTTVYADSAAVVAAIGGTTWVAFGGGKVLVGLDSGDSDFNTAEETGGSKTDSHTLTTAEIPAHTHTVPKKGGGGSSYNLDYVQGGGTEASSSTGGGGAHSHDIVQPYIVVYFWKRTA
jgi:microcystin-dependent protein